MRKLILVAIGLLPMQLFAQSTVGQVAHWNMNGSGNDISGNGNHGRLNNVTPAAGKNGVMGQGYYFNGINSKITVPYSPELNVSKYTICATVKVQGFYSGTCHANTVLFRGKSNGGYGTYNLYFSDAPYNPGCVGFDSTKEVFTTGCGHVTTPITSWGYTPHIVKDTWYSVVGTCNDTVLKIYINGVLMRSVTSTTPGPAVPSTDSLSIGFNTFEAPGGYPYPFKGVIDDIRLYNRVLDSAEIVEYTGSTLTLNDQEKIENFSLVPNPATNVLSLVIPGMTPSTAFVRIYDMAGRLVLTQQLNRTLALDVSSLRQGCYMMSAVLDGEVFNTRFLKE